MSVNEQPAFEVRLRSRRVQREPDNLHEADYRRVAARLKALAKNPRPQGCEKLYEEFSIIQLFRQLGYKMVYLTVRPCSLFVLSMCLVIGHSDVVQLFLVI
jgi:hypothetical protein